MLRKKKPVDFFKKLDGYFIGFCRRSFRWSPMYKEVLKKAFVKKRGKVEYYKCALCSEIIPRKQKQVDHKEPVAAIWAGHKKGRLDWNKYRDRLFVPDDALQILCKDCHLTKSQKENTLRRAVKRNAKS